MTLSQDASLVRTRAGELRGLREGKVVTFRAVPYAAPPVGPLRFAPPQPAQPWNGVRAATERGVASLQPPSYADAFMGPLPVPGYDEDCLTLSVWTPAPNSDEKLPVLVWFHGGGFMFGAGSAAYYDGRVMAERGRMVVVSVNYRLGALGYLYLAPGVIGPKPVANLGLQDQCQALEWVRDNIASFGGDPGNVTVAGQSAGALSIIGLAAMPRAAGLFRRAIMHSGARTLQAHSVDAAQKVTDRFLRAAGVAPGDVASLRSLAPARILEAQQKTIMEMAAALGYDPRLRPAAMAPFQLIVDGEVLPIEPAKAALQGSFDNIDVLLLNTAEEMRFVFSFDDAFWKRDRGSILADVERTWGEEGVTTFAKYERRRPTKSAPEVLSDMLGEEGAVPSIQLAERLATIGRPAYYAWFTWRSPAINGRLGAAHVVELPFVFNNAEDWAKAPMVAAGDASEIRLLSQQMQDAWISFAATGVPRADWPAYVPPQRAAMEFGPNVRVMLDPAPDRTATGLTFRAA